MSGRPILTAAEMRAAEAAAIAAGTPVETLMERAGAAAAEAVWRYAGPMPALILCGPGNNGGDGFVVARHLQQRGVDVRVAALGEVGRGALWARAAWPGTVESLSEAAPAPLLIDALFGTGLSRPLDEGVSQRLCQLAEAARVRVALDLPSGVATDDGCLLSPVPDFDLTITFASLKPSHLLQPAARHMGRIVVADIGIEAQSGLIEIARPVLPAPGPDDHKYKRGYLLVVAGEMTGAAALAASAGLRAGAGYVALVDGAGDVPHAVVHRVAADLETLLADERVNAVVVGPGLGRSPESWDVLEKVMAAQHPVIVDGDGLWLLAEMGCPFDTDGDIATPHPGEFSHMFGDEGSKLEAARMAANRAGFTIVYKGADTVIAEPDGRVGIASAAPAWLASAGTGDVLAGIVAAMRASGLGAFEAACAGVWLHRRAAELAGPALIADDLVKALPVARAECV